MILDPVIRRVLGFDVLEGSNRLSNQVIREVMPVIRPADQLLPRMLKKVFEFFRGHGREINVFIIA